MIDAAKELYDRIARRKGEADSPSTYAGGNGRIDRAVDLIRSAEWRDLGLPTSGRVLDVGGATGNLGYALRDLFESRVVVDIVEDCREPAEAKGNVFYRRNVDIDGLPSYDWPVDLIVALDFIEHILDPLRFAQECYRLLRPGGTVLINTPNIQFWGHLECLATLGRFPHTSGDTEVYHGGHTAFYNRWDMERIFGVDTGTGFVGGHVWTRGLEPKAPPPIWLSMAKYPDALQQLSYADLVWNCRKPE